jgi:hypothetical protein
MQKYHVPAEAADRARLAVTLLTMIENHEEAGHDATQLRNWLRAVLHVPQGDRRAAAQRFVEGAMDVMHNSHSGIAKSELLVVLQECANFVNADAWIVAQYGLVPVPQEIEHYDYRSHVFFNDSSHLAFEFDVNDKTCGVFVYAPTQLAAVAYY